jgi:radical SAM superfamily enzyme YgiQ (UPF0313 family)
VVLSCFDRSTRMLPFLFYDSRMFPAGAALIAGALQQAGFSTRAVFELWNPRFRPSRARIDGRPLDMLLVSSMQIHAQRAYAAIADALAMGEDRPLIIAGGPKAIFEPYDYWSQSADRAPRAAPDVAVTGEAYVLLELLSVVRAHRGRGETMHTAFERAREAGALASVPGLVYLAPGASRREPVLVDTGLQRLVRDLDELPLESVGLSLLEPPHRRATLSPSPILPGHLHRHVLIVALLMTQGCKFRCAYCPIPALHQKSWRHRSAPAVAESMRIVHEHFGLKHFFAVDDNFFNRRDTAEALLSHLAGSRACGRPFGERLRFGTEATQADTYKNRDLLPLARAAGMHSLWFGIEDLTAALVNKGQKPERTLELFRLMHAHKICPMAMLMFHQGQPFRSADSLYGLLNQVSFLRRAGAITIQCAAHTPAVGTREFEDTYASGQVIARAGGYAIREAHIDGNHVVIAGTPAAWKRQVQLWAGYAAFYNPLNLLRALRPDGSPLRRRRIGFQLFGALATVASAPRMLGYALRLMFGGIACHVAPPPVRVPVRFVEGAVRRYGSAQGEEAGTKLPKAIVDERLIPSP